MLAAIQLLLSHTAVAIVIVPSQPTPHLSPRQLEGLCKLEGSKGFSSQMKYPSFRKKMVVLAGKPLAGLGKFSFFFFFF